MNTPAKSFYDVVAIRAGEILHYVWDPIGVSGVAEARDEYDSYVPQVVRMLFENKSKEQIAHYLYEIEGQRMGLTVGSAPGEHREDVASMLIAHYECLKDRA